MPLAKGATMPGLINQLTSMFKNGLNTLLEPAADPRETFADPYQRQYDLLERVREALMGNSALRKRLEIRMAELQQKIPNLETSARQAVADCRDDRARLFLQQRHLALLELKSLTANCQEIQLEEQRIAVMEQRLTAQLEALRLRQQISAVRYTSAESQVAASEAMNLVARELGDLGQTLERAEQKTEYLQARAAAIEQWSELSVFEQPSDIFSQQLSQVEIETAIEAQLAALKQK
jgi:phage shock protein A